MNEDLERDLAGTGMLDFAAALRAAPQACVSTGFADGVMAAVRAERTRAPRRGFLRRLDLPSVLPAAQVAIRWTPNRTLAAGSRNSHLFLIQSMLRSLARFYANAPALTVTGVHDAPSVAAVKWLQKLAALPPTGEIDQTTWAYLSGLYTLASGDVEAADQQSTL